MNRRNVNLVMILVLLVVAIYIDVGGIIPFANKSLQTKQGLDLQGGIQALLEVDLPADKAVTAQQMSDARQIIENRVNGLGVSETTVQIAGERRMIVEIPGETNPQEVFNTLKGTGLLEFVDLGDTPLSVGTVIQTDHVGSTGSTGLTPTTVPATQTAAPTSAATAASGTPTIAPTATTVKIWPTVLTGDQLNSVGVTTGKLGDVEIAFELKADGAKVFGEFTKNNIGKTLAIVLDKKILSNPSINSEIAEGKGVIQGKFTLDEANSLAVQMRYGSLPVPLKVVESKIIGPSLGKDSLNKSILAGIIGFVVVTMFMIIYYRFPGVLAILSIGTFAMLTLAIFNIIGVTLTLPGIAGFLLSSGSALDSNILIFERMKEELRNGRTLGQAIDLGWKRAWPSIRDSNFATLITSAILFWFGSTFGATIVKGFAVTLALGVIVSLFCSIIVTRTFLSMSMQFFRNPAERLSWFGL
jgi:preprotein translocase subunit SecD